MVVSAMSRPGQSNGSGNDIALFLKLFAGEVLTQFSLATKFMPLHRVRTISNGKSASFPVTGIATSKYHVPGESVYGTDNAQVNSYLSSVLTKERELFCDDPLLSGVFVPSIDKLREHWDSSSVYAGEIAEALAKAADLNVLSTLFAAAKADSDFVTTTNGYLESATGANKVLTTWTDATVAGNLSLFAFKAAEKMDQWRIPKEGRYLVLRPKQYYLLTTQKDLVDRDYTSGSNGDYAQAELMKIAGMNIVVTNNMPVAQTADAALGGTSGPVRNNPHGSTTGYTVGDTAVDTTGGWNRLGALAFQSQAVGTVRLREMSVETERSVERQGNLILASYAMGHGVLRPECAIAMRANTI